MLVLVLALVLFEIDLKVQAFKKENKDILDLLEAKCLLQQDIVSLQIDYVGVSHGYTDHHQGRGHP